MVDVPWPVVYEAPCPALALGPRRFDIRHRAVIMGRLDPREGVDRVLSAADRLVADGADALDLSGADQVGDLIAVVEALGRRFDVPLCVGLGLPDLVSEARAAGVAVFDATRGPADPDRLSALLADGATVIVAAPPAGGMAAEHLVADPGLDLRAYPSLAGLGHPLCLSVPDGERGAILALAALGIALGARLLRTRDGRGARRTADVMASVLAAREPVSP